MTNPPPPSPEKRALIEAYEEALRARVEREEGEAPAKRRPHVVTILSMVLLAGIAVWFIVVQPDFLVARTSEPEPPEVQEASLRLAMAMQYGRIVAYQDSAGRLPLRADEAGPTITGVEYQRLSDSLFTIRGDHNGVSLTLTSTDSLRPFVGNSYDVLDRRAAQ